MAKEKDDCLTFPLFRYIYNKYRISLTLGGIRRLQFMLLSIAAAHLYSFYAQKSLQLRNSSNRTIHTINFKNTNKNHVRYNELID